jgi:osomolarity two-component system response regulator SSK1
MALSSELSHLQEISLELADSVQLVIQTLLQLSPPQVLDPAKEQFAACSVSIPTPSLSAIFTSVKNLNYMAGNMAAFSSQGLPAVSSASASALAAGSTSTAASTSRAPVLNPIVTEAPPESSIVHSDFDIGELLQSVGDAVSGYASEVGVDVVLYHGDVGMKHIAVRGDECGVSYALTHVGGHTPLACVESALIKAVCSFSLFSFGCTGRPASHRGGTEGR